MKTKSQKPDLPSQNLLTPPDLPLNHSLPNMMNPSRNYEQRSFLGRGNDWVGPRGLRILSLDV
jgi:hypothetical protein